MAEKANVTGRIRQKRKPTKRLDPESKRLLFAKVRKYPNSAKTAFATIPSSFVCLRFGVGPLPNTVFTSSSSYDSDVALTKLGLRHSWCRTLSCGAGRTRRRYAEAWDQALFLAHDHAHFWNVYSVNHLRSTFTRERTVAQTRAGLLCAQRSTDKFVLVPWSIRNLLGLPLLKCFKTCPRVTVKSINVDTG